MRSQISDHMSQIADLTSALVHSEERWRSEKECLMAENEKKMSALEIELANLKAELEKERQERSAERLIHDSDVRDLSDLTGVKNQLQEVDQFYYLDNSIEYHQKCETLQRDLNSTVEISQEFGEYIAKFH